MVMKYLILLLNYSKARPSAPEEGTHPNPLGKTRFSNVDYRFLIDDENGVY